MRKLYWLLAFIMLTGFTQAEIQITASKAKMSKMEIGKAEVTREESIAMLYIAIFGRAPDSEGLEYWVNTDMAIEEIAMSFFEQAETQLKYPPELTVHNFILAVYRNVFNRYPDKEGREYWTEAIESGRISRDVFILAVINGAKGDDAVILKNKLMVGLAFARAGRDNMKKAYAVIKNITADKDSANDALCKFGLDGCKVDPKPTPPPAKTPPVAVDDFATTPYNTSVLIDVLANDID